MHTNSSDTVLLKFDGIWDGLYVPAGMLEPDHSGDLRIAAERMTRWWYYDTDLAARV